MRNKKLLHKLQHLANMYRLMMDCHITNDLEYQWFCNRYWSIKCFVEYLTTDHVLDDDIKRMKQYIEYQKPKR